jgi:hypothetical protein
MNTLTAREQEILEEHLSDAFNPTDSTPERHEIIELLAERIRETDDEPQLQAELQVIQNKYVGMADPGEAIGGQVVRDTMLAPNAVEHAKMVAADTRFFTTDELEARAHRLGRKAAVDEITSRLTIDGQPLRGVEAWVLEIIAEAAR